jgi:hypothetical protein
VVAWTPDDVRFLARKWDERVLREVSRFDTLVPEIVERGTVLRDPATEEQVAQAEKRLGIRLPTSYRAFLLVSNGAHASSLGAERIYGGRADRHGLVPVENVAYAAEADADTVEMWTRIEREDEEALGVKRSDDPPASRHWREATRFARLQDGLLLSRPSETNRLVLVPRPGVDEWELWGMHHSGASVALSFGDYLWLRVHGEKSWSEPERAEEYVKDVRAGRLQALDSLAEIGDPRAGELAARVLVEEWGGERSRFWAAVVLRKLADPAHIPALRHAYKRARYGEVRMNLLSALEACGAPEAPDLLRAASREDPDRSARDWAARRLTRDEPGEE